MPSDTNKNDPSSLLDDLASDIIKGVGGVSKSNCNLSGEPVINALLLASSTGIEYSIPNTSSSGHILKRVEEAATALLKPIILLDTCHGMREEEINHRSPHQ